jgi:mlo protein
MGTNYKAALIPQRIRETIHGWKKTARRKRRLGIYNDDSTIHTCTDTSTVVSVEEDDRAFFDGPATDANMHNGVELQPLSSVMSSPCLVGNETSSRVGTPLLRPSASVSASVTLNFQPETVPRSASMK